MADEQQKREAFERHRAAALDIFLAIFNANADDVERLQAISWFNDAFKDQHNGDAAVAANHMVALFFEISEAKATGGTHLTERQLKQRQAVLEKLELQKQEDAKRGAKAKKRVRDVGSSSSDVGPASDVPAPSDMPAPSDVPAPAVPTVEGILVLVTFLRQFAAMSAAEQCALLEKLQRQ